MATPHLSIGTATSRINLTGGTGYRLADWTPQAIGSDASFGESALADYRLLQSYRDVTATDTFTLHVTSTTQDTTIRLVQELRRMLRSAQDYQATNWQGSPVYLKAKAKCETNYRYALVINGEIRQDAAPYQAPFYGKKSTAANLTLAVEHGPWLENAPGSSTCVQASGTGSYYTTQTTVTGRPAASTDDGHYVHSTGSWSTGAGALYFGDNYDSYVRFTAVNIPQGSIIISAYVTVVADGGESHVDCNIVLIGEDSDDAATYSTHAEAKARPKTTASVDWHNIPAWVVGTSYTTPDLSPIIQEIVDRPLWVSGNDMALTFANDGSTDNAYRTAASWDSVVRTEPILTVVYATATPYGRSATCDNEILLANKNNKANITHVYRNNGGAWENVGLGAYPYGLFPTAPVQNNDALYFGIQTATGSGPFCSLVFDVGTAATWAGAIATNYAAWQYWNGAAWTTLTWAANNLVDNTAYSLTQPFAKTGVNSVHWSPPSAWATNDPGMGVTGFWIRCLVVLGAGSVTVPTQQNRDVYTVTWGSVLIDDGQVPGDLPALMRVLLHCPSGTDEFDAGLGSDKLVMGLRSTDRGEDFVAYINLSNEQNPIGTEVMAGGGMTVPPVSDPRAVTGKWQIYTPTAVMIGNWDSSLHVGIYNELLGQFRGTYHAYVRAMLVTGAGGVAGDIGLRLWFDPGPSGAPGVYSQEYFNKHTNINELFDLGSINIPVYPTTGGTTLANFWVDIQTYPLDDDFTVRFHDLILIPTDEWAASIESAEELATLAYPYLYTLGKSSLDVDGVNDPLRAGAYVVDENVYNAGRYNAWRYSPNGWPSMKANKSQRLWIVAANPHWSGTTLFRASSPYIVHAPQFYRNARYYSMRGKR